MSEHEPKVVDTVMHDSSCRNRPVVAVVDATGAVGVEILHCLETRRRSLALFVAGDQLLKGAALNAEQIAEHLL